MFYAGFGKPITPYGKLPYGKVPFGKGYPATKASGFSGAVPVTSVATTPFPGI